MKVINSIKWALFSRLLIKEYHNIYNHITAVVENDEAFSFKEVYANYIELSSYTQEIDFIETERQAFFKYLDYNYDQSLSFNENIKLYTSNQLNYTVKDITND